MRNKETTGPFSLDKKIARLMGHDDEVAHEVAKPFGMNDIQPLIRAIRVTLLELGADGSGGFWRNFARERIRNEVKEEVASGRNYSQDDLSDQSSPIRSAIRTIESSRPPKRK